jgi:hypothetical protein
MSPCKTRGQDGFATSFPVGLFHPLQHAGLARHSPVSRPTTRNSEGALTDRRVPQTFKTHIEQEPNSEGDRVKINMSGKILPYKRY